MPYYLLPRIPCFFQCNVLSAAERKNIYSILLQIHPLSLSGNVIFITFQHFQPTSMLSAFCLGGFLHIYLFFGFRKKRREGNAASCNMACEAELLS